MEELLRTARLEEGKPPWDEQIKVARRSRRRERNPYARLVVHPTSADPCAPVEFAAPALGSVDLVRVAEPSAERNEAVVSGDHDPPDSRLGQLGHDSRQCALGVRKPRPGCAEQARLAVHVELGGADEDGLGAFDLLAKGLLSELYALAELEVGDIPEGAA